MADGVPSGLISRFLKVPPEPDPPLGSPGSVKVFNAAPGYYRYRIALWVIRQVGTGVGIVFGLFFVMSGFNFGGVPWGDELGTVIEVLVIAGYLLQLPLSFMLLKLDYRYRWYMTTDTSLRIREGITTVRERTMTYANIQNLSLKQGPIQRFFGIVDLQVRTAGGGGESAEDGKKGQPESDNMHLGYFRGVDNAEEIRDLILKRMQRLRDSGLGDPDDAEIHAPAEALSGDPSEVVLAAREMLAEAKALRAALGA